MAFRALVITFAALLAPAVAETVNAELTVDQVVGLQQEVDGEFKRLDADSNGYLDSVEAQVNSMNKEEQAELMKHDTDKDGKLSKAEVMNFARANVMASMAAQDAEHADEEDGDEGEVGQSLLEIGIGAEAEDFQEEVDGAFKSLDADSNGYLDSTEAQVDSMTADARAKLMEHDTDKDGKLSREEVISLARANMHKDGDEERVGPSILEIGLGVGAEDEEDEDGEEDAEEGEGEEGQSLLELEAGEEDTAEDADDEEEEDHDEDDEGADGDSAPEENEDTVEFSPAPPIVEAPKNGVAA